MDLTLNSQFLDNWIEPLEGEYQPLLDFEEAIQNQSPFHNLDSLTSEIKRGFLDYVRQGIMLHTIRRYRLYKDKFKDFKSYCEQGLGRQHFYCKQIIKAASVCLRLIKSGFKILPNCVAQALPLVKFATVDQYGESPLESKWREVVEVVPQEKISAVTIAEIIDENPEPRLQQVRIKKDTYAILAKKAAAAGLSFVEFLDRIADEYNPPEDDEPTEHTPEQLEILDQLDAEFEKVAAGAIGKTDKPVANIASDKLSTCYQKAINLPGRSDDVSDSS
ncbi:hypothetical protein QUA42_02590 [Microcoleus sp. Pol11C2]|uniref:hypothetical protein n=1 Tax=Microcoleus sp. Pol11C2 TaxID=3055389 RepID=UPI002FD65D85